MRPPTFSDLISRIHESLKNPGSIAYSEAMKKLNEKWIWGFTGLLYIPFEGVFIEDNPRVEGNKLKMDRSNLTKRLERKDPSVRFVELGFIINYLTDSCIDKHPLIKGLAGEEGAAKLEQISFKYTGYSCIHSLDELKKPFAAVTSLASYSSGKNLDIDCLSGTKAKEKGYCLI